MITSKLKYEAKIAEEANKNPRRYYNCARTYSRGNGSVDSLEVGGELLTSNQDKASALNEYVASVVIQEPPDVPWHALPSSKEDCLYTVDVEEANVLKHTLRLKPHKAVGPDGISPMVLKNVGSFARPLKLLFTRSIRHASLPQV